MIITYFTKFIIFGNIAPKLWAIFTLVRPSNIIFSTRKNQNKTIKDVTVACFGLAFKANIDDLRESPALNITKALAALNFGKLLAVEPHIIELPENMKGGVELVSIDTAIRSSDICVLLVDHAEFKSMKKCVFSDIKLIDTKGIFGS